MPERDKFSVNSGRARATVSGKVDALAVALASAPADARAAMRTLFALDDRFRTIVATTSEPLIGQMRLAWWRDALARLDGEAAPAEPLLGRVQAVLIPRGVTGAMLALLADRWEEWLTAEDRSGAASAHGATLFSIAAELLGVGHTSSVTASGEGWALAGLAAAIADRNAAKELSARAEERFATAFAHAWPRPLRPLGVLALLSRADADPAGSRWRHLGRLLRFRLTGR